MNDLPKSSASLMSMDRHIRVPFWRRTGVLLSFFIGLLVLAFAAFLLRFYTRARVPVLNPSDYGLRQVERGVFEDKIRLKATIRPKNETVVVATVSGTVNSVQVENGQDVNAGDMILSLTNQEFSRKALGDRQSLLERLSEIDKTELDGQKSLLSRRAELEAIRFDVLKAERSLNEAEHLHKLNLVSGSALDEAKAVKIFQTQRLNLSEENYALEESLQANMKALNAITRQNYKAQLSILKSVANSLVINSSASGRLTRLELVPGRQVSVGEQIAVIESLDDPILTADVDEFYLNRLTEGVTGTARFKNNIIRIEVTQVNPTVTDGKFGVDMIFLDPLPAGLRTGQSTDVELEMQTLAGVTYVSRSAYESLPDKRFVYVKEDTSDHAIKTTVRFGRRSDTQVEVISGLSSGNVFMSTYPTGIKADKVRLIRGE